MKRRSQPAGAVLAVGLAPCGWAGAEPVSTDAQACGCRTGCNEGGPAPRRYISRCSPALSPPRMT